jgi:N-hydroxyarylamine O-acetyltransferase
VIDVDAYLARIGYDGPRDVTAEVLRALHVRHLRTVPFENLDIHWKRPIVMDVERFLDKIVRERRGGFCYELNGAFAELLRALGFDVTVLSARVDMKGTLSPDFDHMALLVPIDGRRFLADVGFGDSFLEPLDLDVRETQQGRFVILSPEEGEGPSEVRDGRSFVVCATQNDKLRTEFVFTLEPRALEDFAPRCEYQQTSPESHFTQRRVCTLPTEWGRITLTNDRLITTRDRMKTETPVAPDQWDDVLRETFGITNAAAR